MIPKHKDKVLVVLYKVVGALSFLLSGIYISNISGPEAFGYYATFFATVTFLTMFGKAGLDLYLLRYGIQYVQSGVFISLLQKILIRFLVVQVVCDALLFVVLNELKDASDVYSILFENFILLCLCGLLIGFSDTFSELWRINSRLANYSMYKFMLVSFFTLIFIVPFHLFGIGSFGFEAITLAAFVYFLFMLRVAPFIKGYSQVSEEYKGDILKLSMPMMMIGGVMFVMSYADTYIISYIMGAKFNGYFASIMRVSAVITFITSVVITIRAKGVVDAHLKGVRLNQHFYETVKAILFIGAPITIAIMLLSDVILGLYGQGYENYSSELVIYVFAALVGSIPLGYYFVLSDRQSIFLFIISFAVVLNCTLNIIFIPKYGLMAAVVATLISNLTWNALAYSWLKYKKVV